MESKGRYHFAHKHIKHVVICCSSAPLLFLHLHLVSKLSSSSLSPDKRILLYWTCVNLFRATMKLYVKKKKQWMLSPRICGMNWGRQDEQTGRVEERSRVWSEARRWSPDFQKIHECNFIYISTMKESFYKVFIQHKNVLLVDLWTHCHILQSLLKRSKWHSIMLAVKMLI